jgi:PKD domain
LDGPSTYTIKVRITDSGGLFAEDEATVNVVNADPTVNTPAITPEPSIKGSAVTASATFGDPAPNDAPFTCTVDYGDGSGVLAGIVSGNTCTAPSHTYSNVGSSTVTIAVTDKDGGTGSNSTTHAVIYNFTGFFQPMDNLPVINSVKAGQSVPVKFSLGGDQGLNIFASGYPTFEFMACVGGVVDTVETTTTGNSSLSYDPATDQYTYVWKTDKNWANKCGTLQVKFNDGTTQTALFKFTK